MILPLGGDVGVPGEETQRNNGGQPTWTHTPSPLDVASRLHVVGIKISQECILLEIEASSDSPSSKMDGRMVRDTQPN